MIYRFYKNNTNNHHIHQQSTKSQITSHIQMLDGMRRNKDKLSKSYEYAPKPKSTGEEHSVKQITKYTYLHIKYEYKSNTLNLKKKINHHFYLNA